MPFAGKNFARAMVIVLALAGYLAALDYKRDEVPPGLNNDVAEEGVRGIQLVEAGRLEVLDNQGLSRAGVPFGHSMETLYLYLVGFASRFLGSTPLAVHLTSWIFVLASIALLCAVVRRLRPGIPVAIPLLVAVSSVWLFHYGRSGLRAVTAPMFLLAFLMALDALERAAAAGSPPAGSHRAWSPLTGRALLCGAILGASLYGYTSARILPLAFLLYVALRLVPRPDLPRPGGTASPRATTRPDRTGPRLRPYALVAAAAAVVSIPNLLELASNGRAFLGRGSYVLPAHLPDAAWNFLTSLALPLSYPQYARAVDASHHFDGVSFGLTVAGLRPVHPLIGLAILSGLILAWPRRREPLVTMLLCLWTTSLLALGVSGPSLTRFLILLPVLLVFATLGLEPLLARPWMRGATVAALLVLTASEGRAYFQRLSADPRCGAEFAEAATDIGRRARELAATHREVLVIVAGNANVVNYLTLDSRAKVWINEFWHRPPDPRELPLLRTEPDVILVERTPDLARLGDSFLTLARRETHPLFDEYEVDPAWDWMTQSLKEGPGLPLPRLGPGEPIGTATHSIL